jgi:hypothetical protein
MIIRFKYLQSSDDALQITAMLKVADRHVSDGLRMTAMLKVMAVLCAVLAWASWIRA